MMSITKVSSASAQHYYAKEDYYTKSAEARESSVWWGEGAAWLGLTGPVEQDQFKDLLEGRLPNGIDLSRNGGDERRAGFDATFSAPKSVSLLAEIGEDSDVREAHKAVVDRALAYIQENAAYARITEKGETAQRATGNLVVARFDHHTSRAGDPQLHTHAVILNVRTGMMVNGEHSRATSFSKSKWQRVPCIDQLLHWSCSSVVTKSV